LTHALHEMMHSLRASPVFALAVLLTLALAGLNALLVVLMNVAPDILPGTLAQMRHFANPDHRIHDLTFGILFVPTVVGMLAQLRRPAENVAGQVMALMPWIGLLLAAVLSDAFVRVMLGNPSRVVAAAALIAAVLHPTGREFFRSFRVARISWPMLALVIVAAGPLLASASTNIGLQRTVADDHAALGHYGFMAAFGFTVIGVGLLASLRPVGWRLAARVAGLLAALLGVASLLYLDLSSSLGMGWALAAIAWGVVFVAVAEFIRGAESSPLLGARGVMATFDTGVVPSRASTASTPRWMNVAGLLALVLVLGLTVMPFIGGAPGGQTQHSGGMEELTSGADQEGNTPPNDGAPELAITADALAFEPDRLEVPPGTPFTAALTSVDSLHDLTVDEIDFQLAADRGETVRGQLMFHELGTFVGYCAVPGHREAGMELEIVVTKSAFGSPPFQH
jgi:plastocyanin